MRQRRVTGEIVVRISQEADRAPVAEVAVVAEPGAVQVVAAGKAFIEAMRKVTLRSKDKLPPSLLPPHYSLDSIVDQFVSWLNEID